MKTSIQTEQDLKLMHFHYLLSSVSHSLFCWFILQMQYLTGLHVFINMHVRLRVEKQQHHYISLNTCTMATEAGKAACCFSFLLTSNFLALQTKHTLPLTRNMLAGDAGFKEKKKKGGGEISD